MKICKDCEKKFGIFEKIFYNDSGEMFCSDCVRKRKEKNDQTEGKFVELKESQKAIRNDYAQVSIPSEPKQKQGKYEFRVVKISPDPADRSPVTIERIEKVINKMGDDGWELVSVIPLHVLLMKASSREEPAMIFKRQKREALYVDY
jgi:hypothetical protein